MKQKDIIFIIHFFKQKEFLYAIILVSIERLNYYTNIYPTVLYVGRYCRYLYILQYVGRYCRYLYMGNFLFTFLVEK